MTSARFDPAGRRRPTTGRPPDGRARGRASRRSSAPSRCWSPPAAPPTSRTSAWRRRAAEVERGFVKVDGRMRTAEPHVYAIGDIVGGLLLAHVAAHEGICRRRTRSPARRPSRSTTPSSRGPPTRGRRSPRSASPSRSANATASRSRSARSPSQAIAKALIGGEYEGFAKVIAHARDRRGAGRPHDRAARHRPDRRGERGHARSRPRPGRSARRPIPHPTLSEVARRGGHGGRRPVDQLLSRAAAPRAAHDAPGRRRPARAAGGPASLAAPTSASGPRRTLLRDVPAGRPGPRARRAHVDPQPGRPVPVRDQRPGPRGRPGRDRLGAAPGPSTGSCPYYRSMAAVPHVRHDARASSCSPSSRGPTTPAPAGARCPATTAPPRYHILSASSRRSATQVLHAAGIALAAKIRGDRPGRRRRCMGEGASNQGDVHEALNFAGIHRLPVVFVVENNGYAISVPGRAGVAGRATSRCAPPATACPGVVVDGDRRARLLPGRRARRSRARWPATDRRSSRPR